MIADYRTQLAAFVRDEVARLTSGDVDRAIAVAVTRYGKDRPRPAVEDVVCPGGAVLPLPTAWGAESDVVSAETPIGEIPPALVACTVYQTPTGPVLRLDDGQSAGTAVRLTFTVPHQVTTTEDSIPVSHREAVAAYGAALLLDELAAAAINDADATLAADTTDRRSKAAEYAARSRALMARYTQALGLGGGSGAGASGQGASGATVSWGRRPRVRPPFRNAP